MSAPSQVCRPFRVPVGFTPDGIPVGMEFLGRDFTEGELLQFGYSWEQATHHRRVPASTPALEPRWSYQVKDGVAAFHIDPIGRQLRFTAPGMDTFVYIDPDMTTTRRIIEGSLRDDHWRIRYSVPVNGRDVAVIWVDDLWTRGDGYTLYGRAARR